MTDQDKATATLRHRIAELLSNWDAELTETREPLVPAAESAANHPSICQELAASRMDLNAKDALIARLQAQVERYAATIIDLKQSEDAWKTKYLDLAAANIDPDATSTELQPLEDVEPANPWVEPLRRAN